MGFEQNRINRSVFLLRSIQIQDIHFEINPKMNMPPFKYYPMSAKKIDSTERKNRKRKFYNQISPIFLAPII